MAQHDDARPLSEMLHTMGGDGLKELLRDVVRDRAALAIVECETGGGCHSGRTVKWRELVG
jgi:hypothetical protein